MAVVQLDFLLVEEVVEAVAVVSRDFLLVEAEAEVVAVAEGVAESRLEVAEEAAVEAAAVVELVGWQGLEEHPSLVVV